MTLALWLIHKINTKDWRIGKVTGWKHPEISQDVIDQIGRQELLRQAQELERRELIRVKWRDFKTDIERIDVSVENMDRLCAFAGVENPREELQRAEEILKRWREEAKEEWQKKYYDLLLERTTRGTVPVEVKDENLFRCLNSLPGQEKSCWRRVFSANVLGDSKLFETKYETRLITILIHHSPYVREGMEAAQILAEHGVLTYSQTLEWKGPLVYEIGGIGTSIDTAGMIYGTIINAQTLEQSRVVSAGNVSRIVTIENKANYEDMRFRSDTLYIFAHGFFSPKERYFLSTLREVLGEDTKYYHWGDMDYGGIRIFGYIKEHIFPEVRPLYMDGKTYEKALRQGAGVKLDAGKRRKLERMEAGELEELKDAILQYGLEIEQEVLLCESVNV